MSKADRVDSMMDEWGDDLDMQDVSKYDFDIVPELDKFIPPLTEIEFSELEKSILDEGVRDSLVLAEINDRDKPILIDGHNRNRIIRKHSVTDYQTKISPLKFNTLKDVEMWMIRNQIGRRNLTPIRRKYLIGVLYQDSKGKIGGAKGKNVAKEIAKGNGIKSEKTVREHGKFAEKVDKLPVEERNEVLSGRKVIPPEPKKTHKTKSRDMTDEDKFKRKKNVIIKIVKAMTIGNVSDEYIQEINIELNVMKENF